MIILLSFIKSNCYANYKKIDAIVAISENDIILESELVREAFNIKNNLISNSRKLPDDEIIISQALEKLIIQSLQLQKAPKILDCILMTNN